MPDLMSILLLLVGLKGELSRELSMLASGTLKSSWFLAVGYYVVLPSTYGYILPLIVQLLETKLNSVPRTTPYYIDQELS